jgi:hypothetical protein
MALSALRFFPSPRLCGLGGGFNHVSHQSPTRIRSWTSLVDRTGFAILGLSEGLPSDDCSGADAPGPHSNNRQGLILFDDEARQTPSCLGALTPHLDNDLQFVPSMWLTPKLQAFLHRVQQRGDRLCNRRLRLRTIILVSCCTTTPVPITYHLSYCLMTLSFARPEIPCTLTRCFSFHHYRNQQPVTDASRSKVLL